MHGSLDGLCRTRQIYFDWYGVSQVSSTIDVIKWKTFRVTRFCEGNPTVIGGFPAQRPVARSFDVLFSPEQMIKQTMGTPVIWDAIALIMTSLLWWIHVWKRIVTFALSVTGSWNIYSQKASTWLFCIFTTIAGDVRPTQGARASEYLASIALTTVFT